MAYTYYWNAEELERQAEGIHDGVHVPLDYTGGSGFAKTGVTKGDKLYVLNWHDGELRILGRMKVKDLLDETQAEDVLGAVYDAPEHLIAEVGTGTPVVLDAVFPAELLDDIKFISADGNFTGPKRNTKGEIEPQTFRNVRRVTDETAAMFNVLLGFRSEGDMDAERIGRLVGFEFCFVDDDARELLVTVETYCHCASVPPRWISMDESISRPELLSDQPWLVGQIERLLAAWREENDAACELLDSIEHQVRDALDGGAGES